MTAFETLVVACLGVGALFLAGVYVIVDYLARRPVLLVATFVAAACAAGLTFLLRRERTARQEAERAESLRRQEAERAESLRRQEAERAESLRRQEAERAESLRRIRMLTLDQVDAMTGTRFEAYVAEVFTFHGATVEHTGRAGDQGCDLVLVVGSRRIACQAKRYAKPVSGAAVREAVAAKAVHGCTEALVVTCSTFTKGARDLAAANGCHLIDREALSHYVAGFREGRAFPLPAAAP
jgi:restriction endonuclease Mrr